CRSPRLNHGSIISTTPRSAPVELTRFIGRARDIEALREIVRTGRVVTLTGPGGSGKSRLAGELAPTLEAVASEGLAWVELAPLNDGALLPAEVLRALGFPIEGGAPAVDEVVAAIGDRSVALVLDNCEHLVEAVAALVDRLLRSCVNLRVLATSREALGAAGERAWLVPPLDVPSPTDTLEAIEQSDSVRLFLERARDVVPAFAPDPG